MRNMTYTTVFQMKHALHKICLSMITPDLVLSLNPPTDFHKTPICL